MKRTIHSLLLTLLSLGISAFGADEIHATTKAAQAIVLPNVTFVGATVQEVIAFLNAKSKTLDSKKLGVHIVLAGAADPTKKVDLQLSNASVFDILQAAAKQAGVEVQVSDTGISLIANAKSTSPAPDAVPAATLNHASVPSEWSEDFAKAVEKARAEKKNVLLDFTGSDWCGFCIVLHKEVFASAGFKSWADKNVVLVTVDFPRRKTQGAPLKAQNAELKKKFMPTGGYPTVVIIDPDGKVIARKSGYLPGTGTDAYLQALNDAAAAAKK